LRQLAAIVRRQRAFTLHLRGDIVPALHREIPAGLSGHAAKMAKHASGVMRAVDPRQEMKVPLATLTSRR
jgi:hypothetical protein